MALYKYFTTTNKLPDPLSKTIPASYIASANAEVRNLIEREEKTCKRGHYAKYTPEVRAVVGKYAAEHGVAATVRHYVKKYPELKESSVRTWRNVYTSEVRKKRGREGDITELPEKKRGRPYLLGEELDKQVRTYLISLRENGAVVNTAIALACAEGIVKSKDSNLLASNGGHIVLTKYWGKGLLTRMGLVKRKASTKAKVEVKAQYLLDIKAVVEMEEIPFDLVIHCDQTGIQYVPVGSRTMEKAGSKGVEIVAVDDKRQITAVFAGSLRFCWISHRRFPSSPT